MIPPDMLTAQRAHSHQARDLLVDIRVLRPDELGAAAAILTQGMLDNPLHLKVFGADPAQRQRRLLHFLGPLLAYIAANGEVLGAFAQDQLIGVLGMIRPGRCQPSLRDRLRFARLMLTRAAPGVLWRLQRWLAVWARNDPELPHWHIGPLTVVPAYRRRGIGRQLMMHCCQRMNTFGAWAWLETDLQINAAFYQTLGFHLARQEAVLGVPNWFMLRPPIGSAAIDKADAAQPDAITSKE